jgi:hypothetical protein
VTSSMNRIAARVPMLAPTLAALLWQYSRLARA